MTFRRAIVLAALAYALLFVLKLASLSLNGAGVPAGSGPGVETERDDAAASSRKNYASQAQVAASGVAQPVGDTQKYEKIATISQTTARFQEDRKRIEELIASVGGLVQTERTQGLPGRRTLLLGVGVPPARFDPFIESLRGVGALTQFTVVRNDKTNEYLALRARRATLEQARDTLAKLGSAAVRIEDSLNVLTHLREVGQELQALGVSLGEFDAANELCTVRLKLAETPAPRGAGGVLLGRVEKALVWAAETLALMGAGLLLIAFAGIAGMAAFVRARALVTAAPPRAERM